MQTDKKWRVVTQATDSQPKIRMSPEMREVIKLKAFENGRSLNSEILVRLAKTLYDEARNSINYQEI